MRRPTFTDALVLIGLGAIGLAGCTGWHPGHHGPGADASISIVAPGDHTQVAKDGNVGVTVRIDRTLSASTLRLAVVAGDRAPVDVTRRLHPTPKGFAATLTVPGLVGADADLALFRIVKLAFGPWVVGLIGGAGLLTALVPGSMILITAATILAKNVYRVFVPAASDHAVSVVARGLVPVLALLSLLLTLRGGQALVALLLMAYNVVTQLFPALVLSLGRVPRVSALAAAAGIIAGELTVATITIAGVSVASLVPSAPQVVKDLNVGIVALVVNIAVIAIVSLVSRPPLARADSTRFARAG